MKRAIGASPYRDNAIETMLSEPSHKEKTEGGGGAVHTETLRSALELGFKNPRLTIYSPMVAAILEYLDQTHPKFIKSETASILLADALKRTYPELWNLAASIASTDPVLVELQNRRRK